MVKNQLCDDLPQTILATLELWDIYSVISFLINLFWSYIIIRFNGLFQHYRQWFGLSFFQIHYFFEICFKDVIVQNLYQVLILLTLKEIKKKIYYEETPIIEIFM